MQFVRILYFAADCSVCVCVIFRTRLTLLEELLTSLSFVSCQGVCIDISSYPYLI